MVPRLQVFFGPMCSGKTHELLKHAHLLSPSFASRVAIKFAGDTRGAALASRTGLSLPATHRLPALTGAPLAPDTLYVLDEGQFFPDLLRFFTALRASHPSSALLCAGLDLDYRAAPFGETLALAQLARELPGGQGQAHALAARCCAPGCAAAALLTQRLSAGGSATVLVGGAQFYRPACAAHHSPEPIDGQGWREE